MNLKSLTTASVLSMALILSSCASKKWKTVSANPVEAVSKTDEGTLKSEWGHIKITYDKTTEEGVFFNIELKNNSDKPVRYERGYLTLKDKNGVAYIDLQNSYIGRNVANSALAAANGNKVEFVINGMKSLFQTAKVLGNGDVAPGALHTDRLIFQAKAMHGDDMTIHVGKELMKDGKLNTIQFVAEN